MALGLALAACSDRGSPLHEGPPPEEGIVPFRSAATCGACHPQHFAEWKASMHAFGGVDPVMLAGSDLAAMEVGQEEGETCRRCHSPALVRQEEYVASLPPNAEPFLEDLTEDGLNCDVCHSIAIVPPVGDITFLADVDPTGPKLGSISDPIPNSFHESRVDNSFRTSSQCAACHQLSLENGVGVENTFDEWQAANLSGMGIECQDCHMPAYVGPAATGGPMRTVHRHHFVGVDYATEPYRGIDINAQKERVRNLLENSVSVVPAVPDFASVGAPLDLEFAITNDRTGHSIPSGTSFARDMWMEIEVRDASNALIYRSGWLEANGDLTAADPDLVEFGGRLLDGNGDRTFFTWRAKSIDESRMIRFNETRDVTDAVSVPPGTTGPLAITATLRFRSFAPAQFRELGLDALLPQIEVFNMWTGNWSVGLR